METAIGTEAETLIKSSPIEEVVVNRSLTVSEYKVQSLLNKYVNFPTSRFVSDVWVNELPNIASESPLINKKAYDITVERLSDCINQINTMIEPQEAIQIESYEDLQFTKKGRSEEIFEFTSEQLEILIQGVSRRMSSPIKNEKKNHEKQSHLGSRSWIGAISNS